MADDPSTTNLFVSAISGLLSGSAGVWWIEAWWRPRRIRRQTAIILVRELAINRDLMLHQKPLVRQSATEAVIPVDATFSRTAIDRVGAGIAELPPETARLIIEVYTRFDHLDATRASYCSSSERLSAEPDRCSRNAAELIESMRGAVSGYSASLATAIDVCTAAIHSLGPIANDKDWAEWKQIQRAERRKQQRSNSSGRSH